MYRALDVMGFAGGFTLGVVQGGFTLVGKREMPGAFGVANCERNRHLLGDRWRTEVGSWDEWTPVDDVHLLFGNPPCSGFSAMTDRRHRGVDAKINHCMWALMEYAARCRPLVLIMESVRLAYSGGREMMSALRAKLEERSGLRYELYHVFQDALDLGGAARRPRYFWVASRIPFGVDYPRVQTPVLRDVWDDLRGHALTWQPQPYRRPPTWWVEREKCRVNATFDGHAAHKGLPIERALDLLELAERDGGWPAGWHIGRMAQHCHETFGYLPPSWDGIKDKLIAKNFHMGFTTLIRWDPDRPARVVTGAALDAVLHPFEPRTITHREAARVMGFPDDWNILPLRGVGNLRATWGKGITVQCGRWIATQVRNALDGRPGSYGGVPDGDREWLVKDRLASSATRVPTLTTRREFANAR